MSFAIPNRPKSQRSSAPVPVPRAQASALPTWYPPNFDLQGLADRIRDLLRAQGAPLASFVPGQVRSILVSDADHTLIKTEAPIYVTKKDGMLLKDERGSYVTLGVTKASYEDEFEALRRKYPQEDLRLEYSEYASIQSILRSRTIPGTLRELRASDLGGEDKRQFILTARNAESALAGLGSYTSDRFLHMDGFLGPNIPSVSKRLGLEAFTSEQRKALVLAGLLKLYGADRPPYQVALKFIDNEDTNLIAAIQLLTKLFPQAKLTFADVIHTGKNHFVQKVVAHTGSTGGLQDGSGKPLSDREISTYHSVDAPFPPRPVAF